MTTPTPLLEWRTDDAYGYTRHTAHNEFLGLLGEYILHPSEKYGGFNIYGLIGDTGWAETADAAKAVAEDDYQIRQRLAAWQEYMQTNDPPSSGGPR